MKTCIVCGRKISGTSAQFCCSGCEAVYTVVTNMKLSGSAREQKIQALLKGVFDDQGQQMEFPDAMPDAGEHAQEFSFVIDGMVCPACTWLIHNRLTSLPGVSNVNVNFIAESGMLKYNPMVIGEEEIHQKISRLGYALCESKEGAASYNYYRFGAGWFFTINAMMLSFVVYAAERFAVPPVFQGICSVILLILGTVTPLVATPGILRSGISQIVLRDFKMESLITLSVTTAWFYSLYALSTGRFEELYFDLVCLLLMITETGNLISGSFYRKMNRRVTSIRNQLPRKVRIAGETDTFMAISEVSPGLVFEVRQKEVIPTDGICCDSAEFDFSLISGESEGIVRKKGQFVGAGASLLSLSVRLRIPDEGPSSMVENIIESTIAAFNTGKKELTLGDRISRYFVPSVLGIALCTAGVYAYTTGMYSSLKSFLSILIVACPCAFGIAEPLVLTTAIDRIRRWGIQVFNGNALRTIPDTVIFDKTGTLTKGSFSIESVHWLVAENERDLNIIASLENGIEHPVARALAAIGEQIPIKDRNVVPARITAVFDGEQYQIGSSRLYPDITIPEQFSNATLVCYGSAGECRCIIALSDTVRSEAGEVIERMKKEGVAPVICSGDREGPVQACAEKLNIDEFYSHQSSANKEQYIQKRKSENRRIMMVGDGINDALALTASDLGVAIFSGQVPAKMSADAVFLSHDISGLPEMVRTLGRIRKKIIVNYGWAFLYNVTGITLAAAGMLSPTFCALGMAVSNILVIINSLYGYGRKD